MLGFRHKTIDNSVHIGTKTEKWLENLDKDTYIQTDRQKEALHSTKGIFKKILTEH